MTERRLETWERFLRAHATIARSLDGDLVREHGMTLSDYDVLVQLARSADGCLRPSELAERVLLTRSGITRVLARLEKDELVARRSCPDDGRVTYATITPEGREKLRSARRTHLRGIRERFSDRLDEGEVEALAAVFERLAAPTSRGSR